MPRFPFGGTIKYPCWESPGPTSFALDKIGVTAGEMQTPVSTNRKYCFSASDGFFHDYTKQMK
jgi:hypothetical protein